MKIKITFAAVLTFLVLSFPLNLSFASTPPNHTDWGFSFQLGKFDFTQYTVQRAKLERTPVYCEVQRVITNKSMKLAAVRGDKVESDYTPIYYISKPGIYYLSSNIVENADKFGTPYSARIRGQKYDTLDVSNMSGQWSPDSYY